MPSNLSEYGCLNRVTLIAQHVVDSNFHFELITSTLQLLGYTIEF